jgi:TRAP-type mannitol/chloroaromatic compound transport system substrate-binding protein
MKRILPVLLVCVLIIILPGSMAACNSSPKQITWRMATSWTEDNLFYTLAAQAICERVKSLSGGRLIIEPYPADSIVGALDVMEAVSSGKVEIGHSWSGYWREKEASFELFTSIPDQMTAQEYEVWLYGPTDGIGLWKELYAKYNVVPFPGGLVGPEFGFFTNKPVRTLDDFKGLKLRVTGLASSVLQELGATPVLLAPGEIINAMQQGEIDGFEFSVPAIDWPMGFQDVTRNVSLPSWHQPSAMFETIVNLEAYEILPDDLKAILEAACKEVSIIDYYTELEGENSEFLDQFVQSGVQISTLDTTAIQKINEITNKLADEQASNNPFYAKVLKSQRDFLVQYRSWEKWSDFKLYSNPSK